MVEELVLAKKKKSPGRPARTTDRRLRDGLEQAHALKARRRWAEARELLLNLDRTYPQRKEILQDLVEVSVPLNDAHIYQYGCERLYALSPHSNYLPYMLTTAYLKNGWLALTLCMGRRALAQDPANEKAEETRRMLAELEPALDEQVTQLQ